MSELYRLTMTRGGETKVEHYDSRQHAMASMVGVHDLDAVAVERVDAIYPTIRNSNYATLTDYLSQAVLTALRLADQGCVDCDLLGALDDLEATLADHACSDSEVSTAACLYAEDAVAAAVDAMDHSFAKGDATR